MTTRRAAVADGSGENPSGQTQRSLLTVGFDLDMTLLDSRDIVAHAIDSMAAQFMLPLVGADVAAHLGPPMPILLAEAGVPAHLVPALVDHYWHIYPTLAENFSTAMPGAAAAIVAVRTCGGRVVMVTGKPQPYAVLHARIHGWDIDHVAGDLWGETKAPALQALCTTIYVGDHVDDIRAALVAAALPVGVCTGNHSPDDLFAAGAAAALQDLTVFPAWLSRYLEQSRRPGEDSAQPGPRELFTG